MNGIELIVALLIMVFSFYQLFTATNAVAIGTAVLRVLVSVLALVALRFEDLIVLTSAVLLYAVIALFVLAIVRNEVQIKHD